MTKAFLHNMRRAALVFSAVLLFGQGAEAAQSGRIAAVVNDEAISFNELNARLKLVLESAGMQDSDEMRQRLSPQIISVLVDETIRMQEAKNLKLEIDDNELNQGIAALAAQNNMRPEQLLEMLKVRGIKLSTLTDQIRAQIAWTKVIGRKVRPQIDITERDVQAELERLKASVGKMQFLVSEIFLPVEKPEDDRSVRQTALKIKQQAAQDPNSFPKLAQQFSRAAGAEQGGDIGWVQQGQLAETMTAALEHLSAGQVSAPVRSLTGYHIYLLRSKKQFAESDIPTEEAVFERLGLQRLERLQHQYFMDLKAASYIDIRL